MLITAVINKKDEEIKLFGSRAQAEKYIKDENFIYPMAYVNEQTAKWRNKWEILGEIEFATDTGYTCNILIGNNAGKLLLKGKYNIFLGDNAGDEIKECSNRFILKLKGMTIEKEITKEQWESFNSIIRGAIIYKS